MQTLKFRNQIAATEPLKKRLWQQTVKAKIRNQANLLKKIGYDEPTLFRYVEKVMAGDTTNQEAKAAAYYWKKIFFEFVPRFTRDPDGAPPNALLNYGYAILRGVIARNLVGSGLLPTFGIHHRSQYNAYCLADDIMEPYRPYVDRLVYQILQENPLSAGEGKGEAKNSLSSGEGEGGGALALTPALKRIFLQIPVMDVCLEGEMRPLMVACQHTTASLSRCFDGEAKAIRYPILQ